MVSVRALCALEETIARRAVRIRSPVLRAATPVPGKLCALLPQLAIKTHLLAKLLRKFVLSVFLARLAPPRAFHAVPGTHVPPVRLAPPLWDLNVRLVDTATLRV